MSLGKTLSLGILALSLLGTPAQADPINSAAGSGQWTFWSQSSNSMIGAPTYASDNAPPPSPPAPIPVPTVQFAAAPSTPTPPAAPAISSSSLEPVSSSRPDAFINFGTGSYAGASTMTSGAIQPWYDSPAVTQVFGGVPTAQQQSDFANTVLNHVERTFKGSGINVNLSLDPNSQSPHTLSVVSGASYAGNANAIGIAEVGGNGFSFIDKLNYANSVDQLAWADAHNIAHELMHSFGVATHHDQTGKYLDAASANWDMLTSPNTTFSPEATTDILAHLASDHSNSALSVGAEMLGLPPLPHKMGCQCPLCRNGYVLTGVPALEMGVAPVPEPATMVLWATGALVAVLTVKRRRDDGQGDAR
jgi:hypothetical protein